MFYTFTTVLRLSNSTMDKLVTQIHFTCLLWTVGGNRRTWRTNGQTVTKEGNFQPCAFYTAIIPGNLTQSDQ